MVSYQTDGVEMPAIKKSKTTEWIKAVAATYEKRVGEIAYIFCSDEKILEVNRQYLQHDYYTDIITFDYCEGNRLSGDLFISLDTVRRHRGEVLLSLAGRHDGIEGHPAEPGGDAYRRRLPLPAYPLGHGGPAGQGGYGQPL